jgi:hypothetical protein
MFGVDPEILRRGRAGRQRGEQDNSGETPVQHLVRLCHSDTPCAAIVQ